MVRKSLLVGINYQGKEKLSGCINDIKMVSQLLKSYDYSLKNRIFLRDDKIHDLPTRDRILNELEAMLRQARPGDCLFVEYSGHGGSVQDVSGDEKDGRDECLFPCDYQDTGVILDDDLYAILEESLLNGVRITFLIDACHSGTMLDLPFNYMFDEKKDDIQFSLQGRKGREMDVVMISGCLDTQTSADAWFNKQANGAMSKAFHECLTKYPDLSYRDLIKMMNRKLVKWGYPQRPQLSAGKDIDLTERFVGRL